ncbi:Catalase [Lactiplantibacillus plantarum]|nr:Catalase [Lactiplantibacillus plantarum]
MPGVKKLEIKQFYEADKNYGTRVANALGMNIADIISD